MQSNRKKRAKNSTASTNAHAGAPGKIALAHTSRLSPHSPAAFTMANLLARLSALLKRCSAQLMKLLQRKRRRNKLQLLEMQQLGEKRFVAIVRVGRQKFLIGGSSSSVLLLAEIGLHKTTALLPSPLSRESA